jgi:WD40 repeat protein
MVCHELNNESRNCYASGHTTLTNLGQTCHSSSAHPYQSLALACPVISCRDSMYGSCCNPNFLVTDVSSVVQLLWPVAMLCGHSAAITALEICQPSDGADKAAAEVRPSRSSSVRRVTFLDTSGRRISTVSSSTSRRTSTESEELPPGPENDRAGDTTFSSEVSRATPEGRVDAGPQVESNRSPQSPTAAYEEAERLEQRRRSSVQSEFSGGLGGNEEALLSLCADGTICIWETVTGRCRRRRRLPPWVGVPEQAAVLGKERRYVAIACEGASGLGLGGVLRPGGKGVVAIVDTATLAVVQTVAHGVLRIGPVRSLVAAPDLESAANHTLVAADAGGGVWSWGGVAGGSSRKEAPDAGKEHSDAPEGEGKENPKVPGAEAAKQKAISVEQKTVLESGSCSKEELWTAVSAAVSPDGKLVARVGEREWEVRLVEGGRVLARAAKNDGPCWQGVLFLRQGENSASADRFLVWDEEGAASVYDILSLQIFLLTEQAPVSDSANGDVKADPEPFSLPLVASVPPARTDDDVSSCWFCQLAGRLVVRVKSGPTVLEGGWGANPQVTLWRLPSLSDSRDDALDNGETRIPTADLIEGASLSDGWAHSEPGGILREGSSLLVGKAEAPSETDDAMGGEGPDTSKPDFPPVTSSLLIGGGAFSPTCLVRGYANGLIKVFALVVHPPETTQAGSGNRALLSLEGHGAAVLCLAEQKAPPLLNSGQGRVLLSGSLDWTVRVWDVSKGGAALAVFRQHVGPVRFARLSCQTVLRPVFRPALAPSGSQQVALEDSLG